MWTWDGIRVMTIGKWRSPTLIKRGAALYYTYAYYVQARMEGRRVVLAWRRER